MSNVNAGTLRLRDLARRGLLATAAGGAVPAERRCLVGAAYTLVWPIVYRRVTRRAEIRRGHTECARALERLSDDCLDRFYDDVESVVDHLLAHADRPIENLEGWVTSRLNAATVDGHRRRRGQRGALQRPRLPAWLTRSLDGDPWLTVLATELLVWVGVSATAGNSTWPLDGWTQRRAAVTGDWSHDPSVLSAEIDRVLAAMRQRPQWYEDYVERPLGRKRPPVALVPGDGSDGGELPPLSLTPPDAAADARLRELAEVAVGELTQRLNAGEDPRVAVREVVHAVFGQDDNRPELDRPPHSTGPHDGAVTSLLASGAALQRITAAALAVLADVD